MNLEQPESVDQQRARLDQEAATRKRAEQRRQLQERAARRLIGNSGDLGQRDFSPSHNDLFSR